MDVDVMNELMYDTLVRYFKTLAHTGYKSYDVVFKMLVIDFIYEITHTELRYYITNKDIKLMQDLLYQFLGSTCEISFPTNNRPCCVCPPPVITPTTTTSTLRPNKKMYIRNSSDNIGLEVSGGKIIDSSSSVILAGGNLEMSYIDKITPLYIEGYGTSIDSISSIRIIDNKGGTIPVEETSSAGVFRTTSSLYSLIEENDITFIDIKVTKQVETTTTTKPSNTVYYGVIKKYMDPNSFCSIPINELIDRSETKFKPIIGDSVNEFTIPQDGYFSYLIIPVDKVELQYAAFTSGGLTSTYYDSSKPNTPTALDPTPNGAYYSKYTRGGTAPYNKGGSYKGIDYDVYFAYINSGSIPELINIKAKNK